jgi:hypothetical protein
MKDKSVALALVLTFFLGPLGLFYASVWGAVALVLLAAAGVVPTMGFVLIFVWPASMVWAAISASRQHNAFLRGEGLAGTGLAEDATGLNTTGAALNN